MSLSNDERQVIVSREMEKAQKTFDDMLFCAQEGKWEAAANRLYYALFHAMSALLINDGHYVKSHRGLMAMFGEHYIRPGIFDRKDGSLLSDLVIMRDNADYNCFFEANEEKLSPFIDPTRLLIDKIRCYIAGAREC
ncbi:MAG: HEPN domain-containing protein [Bacteroidaceae bacterium]|nr:HEPN domain-containing protein [Bacteroidaceae bacterium]MBR1755203.1 HEPN domain-containing protein [Bacteroidaceae bacterium]